MKMRFREDGTFKIMQITDMQEIPAISKDTIALMERAILEEQPDLVVYTGDQIKGYGVTYKGKGEELEREVAQTIGKLLEPVTKRGIPFAVTFGNHDCQVGISNQDQFYHIYKRLPNCIGEQAEGIDGAEPVPFPSRHPTEAGGMCLNCICLTAERMPGRAATRHLIRRSLRGTASSGKTFGRKTECMCRPSYFNISRCANIMRC